MERMTLEKFVFAARRVAVPIIAISSPDHAETIRRVRETFESSAAKTPIPVVQWDAMDGLTGLNPVGKAALAKALGGDEADWPGLTANPAAALGYMTSLPGELRDPQGKLLQRGALVFMLNGQRFFEDRTGTQNGQVLQGIWNLRDRYKTNRRTLVILGPAFRFPPEIAQDVIAYDEPYPSEGELGEIVARQVKEAGFGDLDEKTTDQAIDAVTGLAAFTAEQVVAMSLTKEGGVDVDSLWQRKITVVEQTEGLSVDGGAETFDDVEGLKNFKDFGLRMIRSPKAPTLYVRIDEMEKYFGGLGSAGGPGDNTGTTQDRLGTILREMEDNKWTGFIAVGHAGTGKSLVTKSLANTASAATGRRVLSLALDLGATTGGIVGESERKIRTALKVIKSLARSGRVCFVATCNDISALPPALKRRFKLGTWMFDLPERAEKDAIWALNLKTFNLPAQDLPDDADWVGADIRNVCETADALEAPIMEVVPFMTLVAKSDPEAIGKLRRSAHGRYVSASNPGVYLDPTAPAAGPDAEGREGGGLVMREKSDLDAALTARVFCLKPYARLVTEDGTVLEAISFPFPTPGGGLAIMAREPGDPTTMQEYPLPPETRDVNPWKTA